MLVLSEADVDALVEPRQAIALAQEAYRLSAAGGMPSARADLRAGDPVRGCLLLAGSAGPATLSIKSNVHAYADGPEAPRRWASLLTLWNWREARPVALISANLFNEHRTAAGFAAGVERLAAPDAETATIIGAGKSAPLTALYLKAVRPSLRRLHCVGRSPERVSALARRLAAEPALADVTLVTNIRAAEAVAASAIIVTVTTSDHPVFPGEAAPAGCCIVLGGANRPTAREADDALIRRADIYVDALSGVFEKAGDLALARASGALDPSRLRGEIGGFPDGTPAPSAGADVVLFKSMGLPLQDVLLAEALVRKAQAEGRGTVVDLAGAA